METDWQQFFINVDVGAAHLPHALLSVAAVAVTVVVTVHVLLVKRDERAAIGWIGLIWFVPVVGVLLYLVLGVNRIRRRARALRQGVRIYREVHSPVALEQEEMEARLGEPGAHLVPLVGLLDRVVGRPLLGGNLVEPLLDGDECYPAMIEAIEQARQSVTMETYIFDNDDWGCRVARALGAATRRGVEVRVLIDAAGARYSFPSILRVLKEEGVRVGVFLPASLRPFHLSHVNLRNHRKVMVVDGRTGFTGGMNVRAACVLGDERKGATRDLHFKVEGPVVVQLQEMFAEDWTFATGEELDGACYFPELEPVGPVACRGIADGPDEDLDKLRWTLLGALGLARRSIRVVTPYFLPDGSLRDALMVAAKRGVEVDVIMPQENNLPYVAWAALGQLEALLRHGVRVFFVPGPFDHSKLAVVDASWALLGSANWDPRSLRLNFEYNMECWDEDLCGRLDEMARRRRDRGARYDIEDHLGRPRWQQLRDGAMRLFAPYW